MIAKYGESYTENWAKGLVENFARKPQGNDRAQIIAVANNEADLAVANSYYLGLMLSGKKGEKQLNAGKKVSILLPRKNKRRKVTQKVIPPIASQRSVGTLH